MNAAIIVCARMTSIRLPGKALLPLAGKPVLWHVLRRCKQSGYPVALAIPDTPEHDGLAAWARSYVSTIIRGPEHDVLHRFAMAADRTGADVVIRVTGDCPMVDPDLIVRTAHALNSHRKVLPPTMRMVAYASNTVRRTFPRGLDVEAMDAGLVVLAMTQATDPYDREHVTPFIQRWTHERQLDAAVTQENYAEADWHWCVDTAEDLAWLNQMAMAYEASGTRLPSAAWLRDYLRARPAAIRRLPTPTSALRHSGPSPLYTGSPD